MNNQLIVLSYKCLKQCEKCSSQFPYYGFPKYYAMGSCTNFNFSYNFLSGS